MTRGFTLIEVMVALLLGIVALLLGQEMMQVAARGSEAATSAAGLANSRPVGQLLLSNLVAGMDVGSAHERTFRGSSTIAQFRCWSLDRSGSRAIHAVTVVHSGDRLLAIIDRDTVTLRDGVLAATIEYLVGYGLDELWRPEYESAVTAPTALRLRLSAEASVDTLLFAIGPRG